jgi:hypothetical protein
MKEKEQLSKPIEMKKAVAGHVQIWTVVQPARFESPRETRGI